MDPPLAPPGCYRWKLSVSESRHWGIRSWPNDCSVATGGEIPIRLWRTRNQVMTYTILYYLMLWFFIWSQRRLDEPQHQTGGQCSQWLGHKVVWGNTRPSDTWTTHGSRNSRYLDSSWCVVKGEGHQERCVSFAEHRALDGWKLILVQFDTWHHVADLHIHAISKKGAAHVTPNSNSEDPTKLKPWSLHTWDIFWGVSWFDCQKK